MPRPSKTQCFTCRAHLMPFEVAAKVESGGVVLAWCFKCWDEDDSAVDAYRLAQIFAEPGTFFRMVPA